VPRILKPNKIGPTARWSINIYLGQLEPHRQSGEHVMTIPRSQDLPIPHAFVDLQRGLVGWRYGILLADWFIRGHRQSIVDVDLAKMRRCQPLASRHKCGPVTLDLSDESSRDKAIPIHSDVFFVGRLRPCLSRAFQLIS